MNILSFKKFKSSYRKAFTLVEIVVAIAVLSVGVLGIAAFFANSSTLAHMASNESIASNLAQGYIDNQLSESYEETVPGELPKVRVTNDSTSSLYNFYQQITITLIDQNLNQPATDIGLKKIQVIISYQENGKEKNVTMATIKTKK